MTVTHRISWQIGRILGCGKSRQAHSMYRPTGCRGWTCRPHASDRGRGWCTHTRIADDDQGLQLGTVDDLPCVERPRLTRARQLRFRLQVGGKGRLESAPRSIAGRDHRSLALVSGSRLVAPLDRAADGRQAMSMNGLSVIPPRRDL